MPLSIDGASVRKGLGRGLSWRLLMLSRPAGSMREMVRLLLHSAFSAVHHAAAKLSFQELFFFSSAFQQSPSRSAVEGFAWRK